MHLEMILKETPSISSDNVLRVLCDLISIQNERISTLEQRTDDTLINLERRVRMLEDLF